MSNTPRIDVGSAARFNRQILDRRRLVFRRLKCLESLSIASRARYVCDYVRSAGRHRRKFQTRESSSSNVRKTRLPRAHRQSLVIDEPSRFARRRFDSSIQRTRCRPRRIISRLFAALLSASAEARTSSRLSGGGGTIR